MNPAKRSISPSAEASFSCDTVPGEAFFSEQSPDVAYQTERDSELNEGIVNLRTTVLAAFLMLVVLVGIACLFLF